MKILFHCEQLNYRGTTNSVLDYAIYNQEILGNESVIIYSSTSPNGLDTGSVPAVVSKFANKFKLLQYDSNEHLNEIASNYDFCYSQRAGTKVDMGGVVLPIITSTKFGVHCVFQYYDPHGDVYSYISEWLAKNVSISYGAPLHPFVPYIVELPKPTASIRDAIGISKDKLVFGRHGGINTFDISFVKDVISRIVNERNDIVFLFMNTEKFMQHPNVVFINPIFDRNMISNFVSACDAMLHGRNLGESFGLAIAEFLYHNKPVLAWEGGFDRNHVNWLSNYDLLYKDEADLYSKIINFRDRDTKIEYSKIVEQFTPVNVMKKFDEVFLK